MANSRARLQANMEILARKRQKETDEMSKWSSQLNYYQNWNRNNNKFQNWTSPSYYNTCMSEYEVLKERERKEKCLEERRNKLQSLFFKEEQDYVSEMGISPRNHKNGLYSRNVYKMNNTPIEVLKEVNIGLKLAEDEKRRQEAELKLYQQWKNENPILRNYERNQNNADLKLVWLDQQIEKRMEKEKTEEEVKQMIEQRSKQVKEEEEFEKQISEIHNQKEKEMFETIELQMKEIKIREEEASKLKVEELAALKKRLEIEDLISQRKEETKKKVQEEIAIFNLNQSKLKLRKKALQLEEELKTDKQLIDEIVKSQSVEEIQSEQKRNELKKAISSFQKCVRDQQEIENQRQKYISFIFDSEARSMWEKQEKLWKIEETNREKLLQNVLFGIKEQIDEKILNNKQIQQHIADERADMLQQIEENELRMKNSVEDLKKKKLQRKLELDLQMEDKKLIEKGRQLEEEKKNQIELQRIRKEEEKLNHELMQIQRRQYPQQKNYNRRIIW